MPQLLSGLRRLLCLLCAVSSGHLGVVAWGTESWRGNASTPRQPGNFQRRLSNDLFVKIIMSKDKELELAEVRAFDPSGAQIAATGANLGTTKSGYPADLVIDGDDQTYCVSQSKEKGDFLKVFYPAGSNIAEIRIQNTPDTSDQHHIVGAAIKLKHGSEVKLWEDLFQEEQNSYVFVVPTSAAPDTTTTSTTSTTLTTSTSVTNTGSMTTSSSATTAASLSFSSSSTTTTSPSSSSSRSTTITSSSRTSSAITTAATALTTSVTSTGTATSSTATGAATTTTLTTYVTSTRSTTTSSSSSSAIMTSRSSTSTTTDTLTWTTATATTVLTSSVAGASLTEAETRTTSTWTSTSMTSTSTSMTSTSMSISTSTPSLTLTTEAATETETETETETQTMTTTTSMTQSGTTITTQSVVSVIVETGTQTETQTVTSTATATATLAEAKTSTSTAVLAEPATETETETSTLTSTLTLTVAAGATTTTTATTTSTQTASLSLSLSLSQLLPAEALATPEETSAALGRTIATGVKAALTELANSERTTLSTNWGPLLIVNLTSAQSSDQDVTTIVSEVGGKVLLSSAVLQALPPGANLAMLSLDPTSSVDGDALDQGPFRGVQGGALSSLTQDISVYDAQGEYVPVELEQPMLFKLLFDRRSALTSAAELQCAFLETQADGQGVVWSTRGVWRATEAEVAAWGQAGEQEQDGIWCWTQHLSIFAAISQVAFACTNLELLQPEGLRAIFENEDWYLSSAALSTFCVVGVVLATVLIAILWELCQFRLGSTLGAVGKVRCWNFILCGPQLVKHRYAALLVYLRDLGHCFATGRTKLRYSILTASVQRFLAVRTGISVACISQHCWNGGGWIDSPASLPKTTLCHKLKFYGGGAEEVIYREMFLVGIVPAARRLWLTTQALHPLLDAMRVGAGSLTACKRSCLQVCGVIGVLATNAIIFNFSGELQSWEADARCPIKPGSHLFVVVATLVSIAVNAVPNAFLTDFAKQVYRRPCWACVFWACLFTYASLALLIVTAALANQNPKDQSKWHASIEWTITLKLAGMPLLQGLRNTLLLEAFLREDRKLAPEKQFRVTLGLGHAKEEKLSQLEQQEVETMARQAISTEELVRFATLLGDRLMPDFDPDTSTSEDVFRKAIEPLCVKPPNLMDYPVLVQVEEVRGVRAPVEGQLQSQHLCCSVLHLGPQHQKRRPCLGECQSCPTSASADGGCRRCRWAFEARLLGLEPEHAIGFAVHERHGCDLAVAWLPALEVLKAGEWSGELTLQPVVEDDDEGGLSRTPRVSLAMPTEACPVHAHDFSVSQGVTASLRKDVQQARLAVRVRLSEGFLEALALHERQKLREWLPMHESELEDASADLAKRLMRLTSTSSGPDFTSALSSKPFCEARTYLHSSEPPHTMVVHSGHAKFFHLVSAVLADALGEADHIMKVRAKLRDRDFHTLLDMLHEANCDDRRYWIDLFAVNPSRLPGNPSQGSAEERLYVLPSLLRSMRRLCCQKAVADIVGGQHAVCRPLTQLLVMDRDFHLTEENSCLAEMMLAKAMRVNQKLALHPEHLQGTRLAERLSNVEGNFEDQGTKPKGISPGIAPYLQDGEEVYKTLVNLAVQNVKVHREDKESTWKELNMTNMVIVAGTAAQPDRPEAHLRQSETSGPDDAPCED